VLAGALTRSLIQGALLALERALNDQESTDGSVLDAREP